MKDIKKNILFILQNLSNMSEEITIDGISSHLKLMECYSEDFSDELGILLSEGYIVKCDNKYALTVKGIAEAQIVLKDRIKEEFNNLVDRATSSEAYLNYCTELCGYEMYLFNMMDQAQLDFLFHNISISRNSTILDLGCGSGSILNFLVQKYHCKGIGIDQHNTEVIKRNNRLITYINGDLDDLESYDISPDLTISIDSLYFTNHLDRVIGTLTNRKGNQLYLYFSQYIFDKEKEEKTILKCDNTRLAKALQKAGLNYKTIDYSSNEKDLYDRAISILQKYKEALAREGNMDLFEKKMNESKFGKELYENGCASRYLYMIG